MRITIPKPVRVALYIAAMIGTPVISYLEARGIVGVREVGLWSAEVAVSGAVATGHLSMPEQDQAATADTASDVEIVTPQDDGETPETVTPVEP